MLPIVDIWKSKGVSIITVTENMESPLALAADVALKQHANRETDYQSGQFARIHPGGAVGERLNNRPL